MALFVIFVLGVIVGSIFTYVLIRPKTVGDLMYNKSDPDDPYLYLALEEDVSTVTQHTYVMLRVRKDISRN